MDYTNRNNITSNNGNRKRKTWLSHSQEASSCCSTKTANPTTIATTTTTFNGSTVDPVHGSGGDHHHHHHHEVRSQGGKGQSSIQGRHQQSTKKVRRTTTTTTLPALPSTVIEGAISSASSSSSSSSVATARTISGPSVDPPLLPLPPPPQQPPLISLPRLSHHDDEGMMTSFMESSHVVDHVGNHHKNRVVMEASEDVMGSVSGCDRHTTGTNTAIVLFNLGQSYQQRHWYVGALQYFHLAYTNWIQMTQTYDASTSSPCSSSSSSSNSRARSTTGFQSTQTVVATTATTASSSKTVATTLSQPVFASPAATTTTTATAVAVCCNEVGGTQQPQQQTQTHTQETTRYLLVRISYALGYCYYSLGQYGNALTWYEHASIQLRKEQHNSSSSSNSNSGGGDRTSQIVGKEEEPLYAAILNAIAVVLFHYHNCSNNPQQQHQNQHQYPVHVPSPPTPTPTTITSIPTTSFDKTIHLYCTLMMTATTSTDTGTRLAPPQEQQQPQFGLTQQQQQQQLQQQDHHHQPVLTTKTKTPSTRYDVIANVLQQQPISNSSSCGGASISCTQRALQLLQECYVIYCKLFGTSSIQVAKVLNNMGRIYYVCNQYKAAATVYEQALFIQRQQQEKVVPNHHNQNLTDPILFIPTNTISTSATTSTTIPTTSSSTSCTTSPLINPCFSSSMDLAVMICNLGQTYYQLNRLDEALDLFLEFFTILHHHDTTTKDNTTTTCEGSCSSNNNVTSTSSGCCCGTYFTPRDRTVVAASLGSIYHGRYQYHQARKWYEAALQSGLMDHSIMNRTSTTRVGVTQNHHHHPELASILNKLGSVCYKLRDLDAALRYLTDGLEMERTIYGSHHPNSLVTLLNIAQIYRDQNNFAAAFLHYNQVHSIQVTIHGPSTIIVANTLFSMGLMLYRMRAYSSAFEFYQEALFIQRQHYGDDNDDNDNDDYKTNKEETSCSPNNIGTSTTNSSNSSNASNADVAATLNSMGIVLFHLGTKKMAKTYFEESLRIRRKALGRQHPDVATSLYNLATLNLDLGDDVTALSLYRETLQIERRTNRDTLQTLQQLGLVHQEKGELSEALTYFEEALAKERKRQVVVHKEGEEDMGMVNESSEQLQLDTTTNGGGSTGEIDKNKNNHVQHNNNSNNNNKNLCVGKLLNLIGNIHLQRGNVPQMMNCFIEASRLYEQTREPLVIAGYTFYGLTKLHPECAEMA